MKSFGLFLCLFSRLRSESPLSASGQTDVDARGSSHSFRYSLDFPCMGYCIIINNKNFDRSTGNFNGPMVKMVFQTQTASGLHVRGTFD